MLAVGTEYEGCVGTYEMSEDEFRALQFRERLKSVQHVQGFAPKAIVMLIPGNVDIKGFQHGDAPQCIHELSRHAAAIVSAVIEVKVDLVLGIFLPCVRCEVIPKNNVLIA